MSLDDTFGPCLEAGRTIANQEFQYNPQSLQRLDEQTGPLLGKYLDTAIGGLKIPRLIHRANTILWLVDNNGDVWFAIEEVVDIDTGTYLYALALSQEKTNNHVKLGHPSLLMSTTDKRARIGGEIKYVPRHGCWVINNRSGRYGTRPHQTAAHLEAVAAKFKDYEIPLKVVFEEPVTS
ncbi:hypothetical protein DXT91_07745 [Agrobacterium tumefaciens]|uniref:hypothetical protein n=1 Tax=Agrobacterium tumefaciens TaxID=358 RepID=UPI0012B70BCC|nr:hypothetical protein [Agrobacterium tumefaciens]MQB04036.1 hypothetical protein [Agrobacterium tumefaciens]